MLLISVVVWNKIITKIKIIFVEKNYEIFFNLNRAANETAADNIR